MATFKAVVLTGGRNVKSDGTTNIKIRITHNRKINYMSTDLYVHPDDFDNSTGLLEKGKNSAFVNLSITTWLLKCRTLDVNLGESKKYLSVSQLKQQLVTGETSSREIDFFEFTDALIGRTRQNGTANGYKFLANRLKAFTGEKLPFATINVDFLLRFEMFLHNGGARNGITNYMVAFRAIFNKARDFYNDDDSALHLIPHYPFKKYKIPKPELNSKSHFLNPSEFVVFRDCETHTDVQEYSKDMFLLMFYLIGIEAKDLFHLKPHKYRIKYKRFKTGRPYSIKIEPEARKIINKYKGKDTLINACEIYSDSHNFLRAINSRLHGEPANRIRGIFPRLRITSKKVTTKWARHTWATFARNECGINKDDVALCLGHEDQDNKVTDIYIAHDNRIIDESNRKVIDFVNLYTNPR